MRQNTQKKNRFLFYFTKQYKTKETLEKEKKRGGKWGTLGACAGGSWKEWSGEWSRQKFFFFVTQPRTSRFIGRGQ